MISVQSSAVDIDTSLQNVSTAINGYVNIGGDVRTTRDDYTMDIKRDKGLKKTLSGNDLHELERYIKTIHLHLSPIDSTHTRMDYDLYLKKGIGTGVISIRSGKRYRKIDSVFHNSFLKGLDVYYKIVLENERKKTNTIYTGNNNT